MYDHLKLIEIASDCYIRIHRSSMLLMFGIANYYSRITFRPIARNFNGGDFVPNYETKYWTF